MTPSTPHRNTLSPSDRALRILTTVLWIPAFPLLLTYGIHTSQLCPVLGIIPMSISACTGLIHLRGWARSRFGNIFMDLFTAAFLLGILIPGWIMLGDSDWRRRWDMRSIIVVGTYGTMPMMINFFIHAFFVLRDIPFALLGGPTCPHCHGDLLGRRHGTAAGTYQRVLPDDHPSETSDRKFQQQQQETGVVTMSEARAADVDAPLLVRDSESADSYYDVTPRNGPAPATDDESARLV